MAVAVVQDFATEPGDRSTPNYDAINARVRQDRGDTPPPGFILHAAGFAGDDVFRIIEIWETREQFEQFMQEHVMPLVGEVARDDAGAPEVTVYELHNLMTR